MYEYAVKVVCGRSNGDALAPGRYWTAVNIHNPHDDKVTFNKKVAVAHPRCEPGTVTEFYECELEADAATEIDCAEIHDLAGLDFVKGFAVIQSGRELDVVAVYTAGHGDGVETLDVERVPGRRLEQTSEGDA